MSLKDLDIKLSYISCGDDNIAKAFLVPALKQAKGIGEALAFSRQAYLGRLLTVLLRFQEAAVRLSSLPVLN